MTGPPRSPPQSTTRSRPSPSVTSACRSATCAATSWNPSGPRSLSPKPRRSGTITSKPAAASGSITRHQIRLLSGQPCTHSSGTPPCPRGRRPARTPDRRSDGSRTGSGRCAGRSCVLLDEGPEGIDVAGFGGLGTDRRTDHVAIVEPGVGEQHRPVALTAASNASVASSPSTWRKQTRFSGCGATTARRGCSARRAASRWVSVDVLSDVVLQPLGAVAAQHEPELEAPEPPSERDLPVAVVDHRTRLAGRVAQVLGQHGQRTDQRGSGPPPRSSRSRSW